MANSTEEFWEIDGVSLHQYGWSVTTVGGSRYNLPPRRGADIAIAYRPGQVHRRKLPDARQITLIMFMVGMDPATGPQAGTHLTSDEQRTQWNDNWDFLRRTVYPQYLDTGLVTLGRRWRLTAPTFPTTRVGDSIIAGDPGTPASGVSRVLYAFALAEMTGDMAPTMTGRTRSDFQLDLTLADPYFYGNVVTCDLAVGTPVYVWNDGHDVAAHNQVEVDFVGPLTNPVLTNQSTSPDTWVKYTGTVASGQTLTLVPGAFSARQHPNGEAVTSTSPNKIGLISSYGARDWVNLLRGANKLLLTGTGSGHATLRFRPPYV